MTLCVEIEDGGVNGLPNLEHGSESHRCGGLECHPKESLSMYVWRMADTSSLAIRVPCMDTGWRFWDLF